MGERFYQYTRFPKSIPYDKDAAAECLARLCDQGTLLEPSDSVVLVAEVDGRVVGGIVGIVSRYWFNPAVSCATEMAWWVAEEHRGGTAAIRLYREFERWAEERNCEVISMSDLVIDGETPAGNLFHKLGYTTVERAHIKARS